VLHTAARLAAVKDLSEVELARATNDNFFRLFNKVPRASLKAPKSAA
jgi:TatD DNase family protein